MIVPRSGQEDLDLVEDGIDVADDRRVVVTRKFDQLRTRDPLRAEYARAALVPTLKVMGAKIVFERSLVFSPRYLDETGNISDPETARIVREAVQSLVFRLTGK